MPVFLQGTAQTVPEEQLSALQQAPVDPSVKKLKSAKASVEKYQTRIKYTSTSLIVIGAIGMAVSFYKMMTAGRHADKMINGRPHHGPHHPHNRTEGMEKPEGPRYVTHEQFELYDTLKTLATIMFFIFGKIAAVGKCGKMMAWRNRSQATTRLGKKSCLGLVLIALMSLYAAHEGHHIHKIMERVHRHHPHNRTEGGEMHKFGGRHLEEDLVSHTQAPLLMAQLKDEEATCGALGDADGCNANSLCSWCTAGAVADACHWIENAKTLPAAVFQCSKLGAIEFLKEVKPVKDDQSDCEQHTSETSCNADNTKCSWCKAGAVADACNSLDNAKRLPAAVFQCSNLGAEEKPLKDDQSDCEQHTSETSCNADNTKCSWCKAGAVADACNSLDNAKRLPAAVF